MIDRFDRDADARGNARGRDLRLVVHLDDVIERGESLLRLIPHRINGVDATERARVTRRRTARHRHFDRREDRALSGKSQIENSDLAVECDTDRSVCSLFAVDRPDFVMLRNVDVVQLVHAGLGLRKIERRISRRDDAHSRFRRAVRIEHAHTHLADAFRPR